MLFPVITTEISLKIRSHWGVLPRALIAVRRGCPGDGPVQKVAYKKGKVMGGIERRNRKVKKGEGWKGRIL